MKKENEKLSLLNDFPAVSTEAWESVIMRDLKGADYAKKLLWRTPEGIEVKPYYRAEHTDKLSVIQHLPGTSPYVRGLKTNNNDWLIRQDIVEDAPDEANKKALDALKRGAECLSFNVTSCQNFQDMCVMLKDIPLDKINIHYTGASSYIQLSKILGEAAEELGFNISDLKGSFNFDSLGYYLANGSFYASLESNFVEIMQLFNKTKDTTPKIRLVNINGHRIHNAGGLITHEIALALSMGATYLTQLVSRGINIDEAAQRIEFTMAIGSNYFMEIAKIRAARLLWASIVNAYKPQQEISKYMRIHSVSSFWNKTVFDPYVNMLRATTEAMSAAIGGCDSMTVLPFDITYKNPDNFSERIARNLQIILKEEAYFNKVVDVSAGSYYIENLTESLADAAWKMFLEIDEKGGFVGMTETGALSDMLSSAAAFKQEQIAKRRRVLVGTNQYPNSDEFMLDKIQPKTVAGQLTAKKEIRLGQEFEALRLLTEDYVHNGNNRPKVFLLPIGNLAMRKARATFASNFFGCAGYEIIDNIGFKNIEQALEAVQKKRPDIVVICSSDEEYATIGVSLSEKIKADNPKIHVVVAGNPVEAKEPLQVAGVSEFIHIRSNVLDTLQMFNKALGIN